MKVLSLLIVISTYGLCMAFLSRLIKRLGQKKSVSAYRIAYLTKMLNLTLSVFFFMLAMLVLGIHYSQVSVFLSSMFAVIGVALVAQWSILSNMTASLVIFFAFPYRVGDRVKVIDKDDDITGVIEEITLFHVLIRRDNDMITYPNTQILQKAVVKLTDNNSPAAHHTNGLGGTT
ncbi:Uncharacterised protein [BD1-7 clade bacterium]|uniref:Small-conductance mechanosensitive channel n=1 Tax=BD1-7 clade bacterium TaxID=2029982 RepID=A0A5S9PZ56_9GAMM|nr:Uncharacterised protein [BD1-7 clade bacterium]CAA0112972.1 Uncharacterised protein [BD1-7 clade bacterium]